MTLLWFDGFESYANDVDVAKNLALVVSGLTYSASGRFGRAVYLDHYNDYYGVDLSNLGYTDTDHTTLIVGFAINPGSLAYGFDVGRYLVWLSPNVQFHILSPDRYLYAYRSDSTLLGSGSIMIPPSVWSYIEVKVVFDNSSGSIETKINGVSDISVSGIDTIPAAGIAGCNGVYLRSCNLLHATYFDDFYILNGQGSKNNDFMGDLRIDALRPNGAGTYTDFTPSAGSNYENVDESPGPDDDTTYNEGSSVGDKDTYALENLPSPPSDTTIYGVKSQISARKTDAGVRKCKILTRAGTTDHLSSEMSLLSDSFITFVEIIEDNPDDSAAWEDADINSMEVGIEVTE